MTPPGHRAERVQAAAGGSQTDTGPMKNHWHVRDLQRLNLLTIDFSAEQADQVRRTLAGEVWKRLLGAYPSRARRCEPKSRIRADLDTWTSQTQMRSN